MSQTDIDAAVGTHVENLPIDFLRLLFARLSARDLCAAACTCRLWNQLTAECWRLKSIRRWKHGSKRWAHLTHRGAWRQVYRERHLLDCSSRSALRDLAWPVRREGALATLVAAGEDALDELLAAAAPAPPAAVGPPAMAPRMCGDGSASGNASRCSEAAAGVPTQALPGGGGGCCPQCCFLGRRYWAELALAAVRKCQAVRALSDLARSDPRVGQEQHLDRAVLAIAQAHYPCANLSRVEVELAALGGELRRRMEAQGVTRGSVQALHVLNQLLFGPPAPPPSPTAAAAPPEAGSGVPGPPGPPVRGAPSPPSPPSSPATSSSSSASSALLRVVGCDGGLGLRGCSDGADYYLAANSMVCDVLARRRGIPISLAVLQGAVARRGGLGGRLELIGLPTRVVCRFVPITAGGCGSGSGSSAGDPAPGGEREGEEVFIDVFEGGTLLTFPELRSKMGRMGVAINRGHVAALSPAKICERMLGNLYGIYRDAGNLTCLRLVLELWGVLAEAPRDLWCRRHRVSLALEDWADAAECLEALTAAVGGPGGAAGGPAGGGGVFPIGGGGGLAAVYGVGAAEMLDERARQYMAAQMAMFRRDLDDRRSQWQSGSVTQKHRPPAVLYAVGTMVQHRTYGYRGVIVDWDTSCKMDEQWISQMGVDTLPGGGRHQPFYRVLVSDRGRDRRRTGSARGGGEQERAGAGGGGGGGGALGFGPLPGRPGRHVWRPEGPEAELQGLHNRPRAEETYVAQINIHVILPQPAPWHLPAARASGPPDAAAPQAAPHGDLLDRLPGPAPLREGGQGQAAAGPYENLASMGITAVSLPYDYQVEHPELGRYFEGKVPGALRYRLNGAMRHRFPGDCDGCDGWGDWRGGGGEVEGEGRAECGLCGRQEDTWREVAVE